MHRVSLLFLNLVSHFMQEENFQAFVATNLRVYWLAFFLSVLGVFSLVSLVHLVVHLAQQA